MAETSVEIILATIGAAALLAAGVGGRISALRVRVPQIRTIGRQVVVGLIGVILIAGAILLHLFDGTAKVTRGPQAEQDLPKETSTSAPTLEPETERTCTGSTRLEATYTATGGEVAVPASTCDLEIAYRAVAKFRGTCRQAFEGDEIRLGRRVIQPWSDTEFLWAFMDISSTVLVPAKSTPVVLTWTRTRSRCSTLVDAPILSATAHERVPAPPAPPGAPPNPGLDAKKNAGAKRSEVAGEAPRSVVSSCTVSGTNNGMIVQNCAPQ